MSDAITTETEATIPTPAPPSGEKTKVDPPAIEETRADRKARERAAEVTADVIATATALMKPISKSDLRATLPGKRADAARVRLGAAVVETSGARGARLLVLDGSKLSPGIAALLTEEARASRPPPPPDPTVATVTPIRAPKQPRDTKATAVHALLLTLRGLVDASGILAIMQDSAPIVRARTAAFHALVRQRLGNPNVAAVTINAASDAVDLSKLPAYVPPPLLPDLGEEDEWRESLQYRRTDDGAVLKGNALNVATVLLNHSDWRGVLGLDLFKERVVTRRPPPWPAELRPETVTCGLWTDADDALLLAWFQRLEGSDMGSEAIRAGLSIAAGRLEFHPVREWLESLVHDGVPRIDRFLPDYLNTPDTIYEQRIGAAWLRQAVARIYDPGCQADYALILEGDQGLKKSSALRALVPRVEWYADSGVDVTNKDSYENLRGKWVYCLSELASMAKGDVERWKTYITSRQDSYRPSYAAHSRDFLRQTVFCGDTNKAQYLSDATGARRWWPAKVTAPIDIARIERERAQIWAEAVATYKANAPRWLPSEVESVAKEHQAARQADDPWNTIVAKWVAAPTREETCDDGSGDRHAGKVPHDISGGLLVGDVLQHALKLKPEQMRGEPANRVAGALTHLGWTSRRCEVSGVRAVRWFPTSMAAPKPKPTHPLLTPPPPSPPKPAERQEDFAGYLEREESL